MKKILFGITSLTLGGAERVLVDLVNELSNKYDITIFTIYSKGELEKQLSNKVKLQSLYDCSYNDLSRIERKLIPIKILINSRAIYQKYIKKTYDVEIAFLEGAITRLFSTQNNNTKKIAWIHNDISKVFGNGLKSKIKKIIDKRIYSKFEKLIFVSNDNKEKFEKVYNIPNKKEVIYNYINPKLVLEKANKDDNVGFDKNILNLVTVTRLVEQKALDRLARVHSELIKNGIEHKIYVIGDGPERNKIEEIINNLQIKDSFILLGKQENPYPYIKEADCFILLSNFEGYPMTLLEAEILEKFIIITNTAAREVVENYKNKIIVGNNEKDILIELEKFIKNKDKYLNNATKANAFDNLNIIKQVEKIIEE